MFYIENKITLDSIAEIASLIAKDNRENIMNLCLGYFESEINKTTGFTVLNSPNASIIDEENIDFSILGENTFRREIASLLSIQTSNQYYQSVVQTIGASGGIWLIFSILKRFEQCRRVWFSSPTWGNHIEIAKNTNLDFSYYHYSLNENGELDFELMLKSISRMESGDILLIQGCCHNPLGVDLSLEQWEIVAILAKDKKVSVVVDFAYMGLANGIEQDKNVLLPLYKHLDYFFVVNSFSKSLGLYGERLGTLTCFAKDNKIVEGFEIYAKQIVRSTYSMPPQNIAKKVAKVIGSKTLATIWYEELTQLSNSLHLRKKVLLEALFEVGLDKLVTNQNSNGMFINLNLTTLEISELAKKYAIYILTNGRLSLACLQLVDISRLVEALKMIKYYQE